MPDTNGAEILIVEDSATQAEELRYTLEKNGYRVSTARNGKEALEALSRRRPTLIVSDIIMPEMDGFELCKKIKQGYNSKAIPVILLTSLSDPADVLKGLECGADNFITKPYDGTYLLARIHHILINAKLRSASKMQLGVELLFKGSKYFITSERQQILDLLLSTYETAVMKNHELEAVREQLEALNEDLERKVEERTAALVAEIEERKKAEEEVKRLNEGLEQRVAARTLELEAANKALEAFAYSVSHDLRAPLRTIDGFSQMLAEKEAEKLDKESKDYLRRVRTSASHMSKLIDALLNLSRLTRGELKRVKVDLSSLAASAADELKKTEPERRVEFVIADGIVADGDAGMLRAAIDNLMGNAWKYSGKHKTARIEFGVTRKDGNAVYFIRDDGAGFDMQYADKLFTPFHRLHTTSEFPGLGIGLATVQRIVNRHGGRIWAEGSIDKGATFYFTL